MAIAAAEHITTLLNGTISVVKTVLPMEFGIGKPQSKVEINQSDKIGVMIGLEKEINGSLLFMSTREFFSECGNKMFGMPFEGEMLDSFIGEFGNILAGNIATHLSNEDITIDITTPRAVNDVLITDAKKILSVPLKFEVEELTVIFAIY